MRSPQAADRYGGFRRKPGMDDLVLQSIRKKSPLRKSAFPNLL